MQLVALLEGTPEAVQRPQVRFPCHGDPELWFAEAPPQIERAKELCQVCPVVSACLAGALERSEPWGVWGGQLLVSGQIVAQKRPRGRPRKDTVAA